MTFDFARAITESRQRRIEEITQRNSATNILTPDQVQGRAFKATKLLMAYHGQAISREDLKDFKAAIKLIKQSYGKTGITTADIVKISRDVDKERSKQQINMAVPVKIQGGNILFQTNAGGTTKGVTRHFVDIQLTDYSAALANDTPMQAAQAAARGKVRFDCSCKRHRYYYRYISTIMNANAGRAETGFPKIRNPSLQGLACKHVLRAAIELYHNRAIWSRIAEAIKADRKKNSNKTIVKPKNADLKKLANAQIDKKRELAIRSISKQIKQAKKPVKIKPTSVIDSKKPKTKTEPPTEQEKMLMTIFPGRTLEEIRAFASGARLDINA